MQCKHRFVRYENKNNKAFPFRIEGLEKPGKIDSVKEWFLSLFHRPKWPIYEWREYNTFSPSVRSIPKGYVKIPVPFSQIQEKYCGVKQRLAPDNPYYKKIQTEQKGGKVYYIHDNGGCPFLVYYNIKKKQVTVYKQPSDRYILGKDREHPYMGGNDWEFIHKVYHIKDAHKIWVGRADRREDNGNTFLVQETPIRCVFIGNSIYSFDLPSVDTILIKFRSPIGANDSPYAYASDTKGNQYLMEEKVVVQTKIKPYQFFYDNRSKGYKFERIRQLVKSPFHI